MKKTKIEWVRNPDGTQGVSWNPITGCSKISPGCQNCYAERMAKRLQAMGSKRYKNGFRVTIHEDLLDLPVKMTKPKMIFVNSMSDLFHEKIPGNIIFEVLSTMLRAPQHTFQVLTKRSEMMSSMLEGLPLAQNLWLGVSVESQDYLFRVDHLRKVDSGIRFISFEPLLGRIRDLSLEGIHWAIAGGESGPGARPMDMDWVREIKDQCVAAGIPFFLKQMIIDGKMVKMPELDGKVWDEMPEGK